MAHYDTTLINKEIAKISLLYVEGEDYYEGELMFHGNLMQFIDDSDDGDLTETICLRLSKLGIEYDCELADDGYTEIVLK